MSDTIDCPECSGQGLVRWRDSVCECPLCDGFGWTTRMRALLAAQRKARALDPRPSEEIIREQRNEWNKNG